MMTSLKMTSSNFMDFTHFQHGFYDLIIIMYINPANILKNKPLAFRKSKQNQKIFISSGFIEYLEKGTF